MISWDDAFCSQLAARGYRAVSYDDRDIGLSTKSEVAGMPDIPGLIQAVTQGQTVKTA